MAEKNDPNIDTLNTAVSTLVEISANPSTPRNIKKDLTELIAELKKSNSPVPVRAANAISALDEISQDPNMPSYVRVTLWQAVSALERIREKE